MRTDVAPCETVLRTERVVKDLWGSAQQGLPDLLRGRDRDRSEVVEAGCRYAAHRTPDAEDPERPAVDVEERRRDAVEGGLELACADGVALRADVREVGDQLLGVGDRGVGVARQREVGQAAG